jgi:hypothetical protein
VIDGSLSMAVASGVHLVQRVQFQARLFNLLQQDGNEQALPFRCNRGKHAIISDSLEGAVLIRLFLDSIVRPFALRWTCYYQPLRWRPDRGQRWQHQTPSLDPYRCVGQPASATARRSALGSHRGSARWRFRNQRRGHWGNVDVVVLIDVYSL